jgi:hypothetical protein
MKIRSFWKIYLAIKIFLENLPFNPNPHGNGILKSPILENGNKSGMTETENELKIKNASQSISANFFV